jgi:hypothetical protein
MTHENQAAHKPPPSLLPTPIVAPLTHPHARCAQHQPEPSFAVPRDHGLGRFQPAPQASQAGVPYAEEYELRCAPSDP